MTLHIYVICNMEHGENKIGSSARRITLCFIALHIKLNLSFAARNFCAIVAWCHTPSPTVRESILRVEYWLSDSYHRFGHVYRHRFWLQRFPSSPCAVIILREKKRREIETNHHYYRCFVFVILSMYTDGFFAIIRLKSTYYDGIVG